MAKNLKNNILTAVILLLFLQSLIIAQQLELVVPTKQFSVSSLVFSSDGKQLASGSFDGTIKIWDVKERKELRTLSVNSIPVFLSFSPDRQTFAALIANDFETLSKTNESYKSGIKIWNVKTGEEIFSIEGKYMGLRFSPDGRFLVSSELGNQSFSKVAVWELETGRKTNLQSSLSIYSSFPTFSPEGNLLAIGTQEGNIEFWDLKNKQFLSRSLDTGSFNVEYVAFHQDGKTIVSIGDDGILKYWDITNGQLAKTLVLPFLLKNFDELSSSLSPDLSHLAMTKMKNSGINLGRKGIQFFDFSTPTTRILGLEKSYFCTAFSSNGEILASGSLDGTVDLWQVSTQEHLTTLSGHTTSPIFATFSVSDKDIFVGSLDISKLFTFDLISETEKLSKSELDNYLRQVAGDIILKKWGLEKTDTRTVLKFSQKKSLTLGKFQDIPMIADGRGEKTIIIYDSSKAFYGDESAELSERNILLTLTLQTGVALAANFSDDGRFFAASTDKNVIEVWSIPEGKKIGSFTGHKGTIHTLEFSPNGNKLVSLSEDKKVILWNLETGKKQKELDVEKSEVYEVRFSSDGKIIHSFSGNGAILLWDGVTGNKLKNLEVKADSISETVLAPKEETLASLSLSTEGNINVEKVELWDIDTGRKIRELASFRNLIRSSSICFSPDGKTLIATNNNFIRLFNTSNGEEVGTLKGKAIFTSAPDFSRDGRLMISSSFDGTVTIWDFISRKEIVSLFSLNDKDWAVISPDGRFDAPESAWSLMHYTLDNEVIALNQLKDIYYTPNLLPRLLGYLPNQPLADVRSLKEIKLFPEIIEQNFDEKTANLTVKLKNRGGGIGAVRVMLNGNLASEDARSEDLKKQLKTNPNLTEAVINFNVKTSAGFNPKGENCIDIITSDFDQKAQKSFVNSNPKCTSNPKISSRGTAVFNLGGNNNLPEPTLYAIVAGVSDYNGEQLDLNYAAKDAEDFSNALGIGARNFLCKSGVPQCDKVQIKLLSTPPKGETKNPLELPTKANIKAAFAEFAQKAKPEDILVVYFSGHGISLNVGEQETYFYLTQETDDGSPSAVRNRPERSISNTEVLDWLSQEFWRTDKKGIDAKNKVLILDTCAAGAFEKVLERNLSPDQIRALEKLKDRSGLQILMGSAANQSAYEASQYGQGLLTYALLEGMKGAALKNETSVETGTLFDYAVNRVPKMDISNGTSGLQSPRIFGSTSIPIGLILSKADKDAIKIQESPLPIFGRPFFVKKGESDDTLFLIDTFAKKLDEAAETVSRGANGSRQIAPLVFIDKNNFPGAFRVTGTYTEENGLIVIEEIKIKKGDVSIAVEGKVSGKTAEEVAENLLKEVLKKII